MNVYGSRSKAVLETLHPDLQKIMNLAIQRSYTDFGLHEGGRTVEKQLEYYQNGKSRIDPRKYPTIYALAEAAKHIIIPESEEYSKSRAVDIHIAERYNTKKLTWDNVHFARVAGVIESCAQELYEKGEISHLVRWGNDWDSDGVIGLDHKLKDSPHIELVKP